MSLCTVLSIQNLYVNIAAAAGNSRTAERRVEVVRVPHTFHKTVVDDQLGH